MVIQAGKDAFLGVARFFQRPHEEAIRQRKYALYGLFQETVPNDDQFLPSLTGRISHFVISLLLHPSFFVLSLVLYIAMRHFGWDSGQQFCQAIEDGDKKQLSFFLKIGWNPNQQFQGKPLIFIAYEKKQMKVLKRLLKDPNCDPNLMYEGKTLFHCAAKDQNQAVIRLLSSIGGNPNSKQASDQRTPALIAYLGGNEHLALEIIDQARFVNQVVDRSKNTLLNHAWEKKDFPMVESLIQRGAAPPSENKLSHYEVMSKIYEGRQELILTQMIPAGWDINAADKDGHTILERAVDDRNWKFARALVQNGAHITTLRPDGSRLVTFEQFQDDSNYYRDFLEDSDCLPQGWGAWLYPPNWLRGEKYLKWTIPSLVDRANQNGFNPLEKVYFMGSDVAMQKLACCLTYSDFVHDLVQLRIKYKSRIQTDWIINALYEVNSNHYTNFEDKVVEAELVEPPEKHIFLHTIVEEFKKLGSLSKEERTFQGEEYSQEELEQRLITLISTVTKRRPFSGLPSNDKGKEEFFKRLEVTLRQIAYHLRHEHLLPPAERAKKVLKELSCKGVSEHFNTEPLKKQKRISRLLECCFKDSESYIFACLSKDSLPEELADPSLHEANIQKFAQCDLRFTTKTIEAMEAIISVRKALEEKSKQREQEQETSLKRSALIDLAYAGHCARDWHLVLYQVYCLLANRDYQILTFDDHVMIDLGNFRLQLLQNHIYKGQRDAYKYALSMIGETRAIPAEPPDPEDIPTDINRTRLEEEVYFDQFYQPNTLVNAILATRNKDEYFQEYMLNYFKEVVSKRWVEAPYKRVIRDISRLENSDRMKGKEVQAFFKHYDLKVPKILNGRKVTIQSALDFIRYFDCYGKVLTTQPQETLPMGIAKMLESMGYLRARSDQIFEKSFHRSLRDRIVSYLA